MWIWCDYGKWSIGTTDLHRRAVCLKPRVRLKHHLTLRAVKAISWYITLQQF